MASFVMFRVSSGSVAKASKSLSSAKISGHCSWLELCESELEDQGCQALASAVALRGPGVML